MLKLVYSLAFIGLTSAGFGYHDYGLHSTILDPIPLYKPAPILEPAPVIPIVKHIIPPATSYATITQVHVTHPQPIVKAVIAPQPYLKTFIPYPLAHGIGYHH